MGRRLLRCGWGRSSLAWFEVDRRYRVERRQANPWRFVEQNHGAEVDSDRSYSTPELEDRGAELEL